MTLLFTAAGVSCANFVFRLFVRPSVRASRKLLNTISRKELDIFLFTKLSALVHFGTTTNATSFRVNKSKFKVTVESNILENALFGLCNDDTLSSELQITGLNFTFKSMPWSSGNMPDCSVRGPRFKSYRGQLHVFFVKNTTIYSLCHGLHTLTAANRCAPTQRVLANG